MNTKRILEQILLEFGVLNDIMIIIKERKVSIVKKILIAVLALVSTASLCYAAEKAAEPVSATVEATGTFVGKVVSVVTGGTAETAERVQNSSVVVADETGKTMVFPIDSTVKIVDAAMNAVPIKQIVEGAKVTVEYVTGQRGVEKTESIKVNE